MKLNKTLLTVLMSSVMTFSMSSVFAATAPTTATTTTTAAISSTFTAAQQQAIGKIAADYIIANPNVLVAATQKLQEQQYKAVQSSIVSNALTQQNELLNDPQTPTVSPANAQVAVVEFFDYQCMYCSKVSPIVESIMKANPNVKFVFKEFPIFGQQWPSSQYAAEMGYAVYKVYGAQAYVKYHNAIYATDKIEGQLTNADINAQIKALKFDLSKLTPLKSQADSWISSTEKLGAELGLQGTPAFIVMPLKNATSSNTSAIPGLATANQLQQAINLASGKTTTTTTTK